MLFVESSKMLPREVEDNTPAQGVTVLLFVSQPQRLAWSLKHAKVTATLGLGTLWRWSWELAGNHSPSPRSCHAWVKTRTDKTGLDYERGSLETQTTWTSQGLIEIEIRSSHKQTWLLVTVMVTCQVVTQSSWLTESAYRKVVTSIVRERREISNTVLEIFQAVCTSFSITGFTSLIIIKQCENKNSWNIIFLSAFAVVFLVLAIMTRMGWSLKAVLISIAMAKDVEQLWRYFSVTSVSSFENSVQFHWNFQILFSSDFGFGLFENFG